MVFLLPPSNFSWLKPCGLKLYSRIKLSDNASRACLEGGLWTSKTNYSCPLLYSLSTHQPPEVHEPPGADDLDLSIYVYTVGESSQTWYLAIAIRRQYCGGFVFICLLNHWDDAIYCNITRQDHLYQYKVSLKKSLLSTTFLFLGYLISIVALIITLTIYLSFRYVPIFALTKSCLQTFTDKENNNGISTMECICQWNGLIYEMDGGQKKIIATINLQTAASQHWTMKYINGKGFEKMGKDLYYNIKTFSHQKGLLILVHGHLLGSRKCSLLGSFDVWDTKSTLVCSSL